jgi:nucleoside 2-deoxyribosyltransferase
MAAASAGLVIASLGHVPVIPHTMYKTMDRTLDDIYWLEATMQLLLKCDAVVLLDGWEESQGTLMEIEEAESRGIPVYDDVEHWMEHHSAKVSEVLSAE